MGGIYVASSESRIANNEHKVGAHMGSFEQLWLKLKEESDNPIICLYMHFQYPSEVLERVLHDFKYNRIKEGDVLSDWVISDSKDICRTVYEEIENVEYLKERARKHGLL